MSDLGRRIERFATGHALDLTADESMALGLAAAAADRVHGQQWAMGWVRQSGDSFTWECALCDRQVIGYDRLDAVVAIMVGHMFTEHWAHLAHETTEGKA